MHLRAPLIWTILRRKFFQNFAGRTQFQPMQHIDTGNQIKPPKEADNVSHTSSNADTVPTFPLCKVKATGMTN